MIRDPDQSGWASEPAEGEYCPRARGGLRTGDSSINVLGRVGDNDWLRGRGGILQSQGS